MESGGMETGLTGSVIRVYIPSSSTKQNYRNYTFAFVQFEKEDGLMKAIANLNGIWIDGKKVSVGVAKYQKQRSRQEDNRDVRRVEGKWKIGTTLRRRPRSVSISKLRDERTYKMRWSLMTSKGKFRGTKSLRRVVQERKKD
ncbi:uncharacterized protein LOC120116276 [Hibiscus syriacus]|uniref:uncharacterized protein LOC120116276 n=1 Tax=Hibiscus syriacus TaxID=106335 RepID=UPI001924347D|nr:uncharacterized protein LOC120116276 [Hibiscus syriacus]